MFRIQTQPFQDMLVEDRRTGFKTSVARLKAWTKIDDVRIRLKKPGRRRLGEVIFEFSGTPKQVNDLYNVLIDAYFEVAFLSDNSALLLAAGG